MPDDWDGVYKRVFQYFPQQALQILCDVDAAGATLTAEATEFESKLRADGVFTVDRAGGELVVVHVEVQLRPAADFELRLVRYWAAITHKHGRPPRQVVILPRGGPYTGTYTAGGLTLRYHVVDVTALNPAAMLGSDLAPLVLAHHRDPELVDAVVDRIAAATDDIDARATLVDLAMLGADDVLADLLTDSIRRHNMSNVLERTAEGQALAARKLAEGLSQGRSEGLSEGLSEGRTEGLAGGLRVLLAEKFGETPDLDAISVSLAAHGFTDGLGRIRDAATLNDLRS